MLKEGQWGGRLPGSGRDGPHLSSRVLAPETALPGANGDKGRMGTVRMGSRDRLPRGELGRPTWFPPCALFSACLPSQVCATNSGGQTIPHRVGQAQTSAWGSTSVGLGRVLPNPSLEKAGLVAGAPAFTRTLWFSLGGVTRCAVVCGNVFGRDLLAGVSAGLRAVKWGVGRSPTPTAPPGTQSHGGQRQEGESGSRMVWSQSWLTGFASLPSIVRARDLWPIFRPCSPQACCCKHVHHRLWLGTFPSQGEVSGSW